VSKTLQAHCPPRNLAAAEQQAMANTPMQLSGLDYELLVTIKAICSHLNCPPHHAHRLQQGSKPQHTH